MKILLISFPLSDEQIGGEDQISFNLQKAFRLSQHEVDICSRENYNDYNYNHYDFVFSLNYPIQILQKQDVVWATWVFNANLGTSCNEIISNNYDIYFSNSQFVVDNLKKSGVCSNLLNFPVASSYMRENKLEYPGSKPFDVVYLGNYNPEYKTPEKISDFLLPCMDFKFAIYGSSKWKFDQQQLLNKQGLLSEQYYTQIYEDFYQGLFPLNQCNVISDVGRIFINFNAPNQAKLQMINNRMFDLLANGCFIITDDTLEQRNLFGDCVEYSSGQNDLSNKIKFYLNNPNEILRKQKQALEFGKNYYMTNNYTSLSNDILDYVDYYKRNFFKFGEFKKDFCFAIIVNNANLLGNCLRSIRVDDVNARFVFYINKSTRIKATKMIKNSGITNYKINIINNVESFVIPKEDIHENEIFVPTYSNIIYEDNFVFKVLKEFKRKSYLVACRFHVHDYNQMGQVINITDDLPYGLYALYLKNIETNYDAVQWKYFSGFNASTINEINNNIFFESQIERRNFINLLRDGEQDQQRQQDDVEIQVIDRSNNKNKNKKKVELKDKYKALDDLRFSILHDKPIDDIQYDNKEVFFLETQELIESTIRILESHCSILYDDPIANWERLNNIISTHFNYDIFKIGNNVIIKTGLLYQCKPCGSLGELKDVLINTGQYSMIEINPLNYDLEIIRPDQIFKVKNPNGIKIAVLSMCGVSSYEDKYGIGGEHQVIHWLKDACDQRNDVYLCHIFDTYNHHLLDPDNYDIIFSNSCWRSLEKFRNRKDNLTIFWHFNMDSGRATTETITHMGYDWIWTNSYVAHDELKNQGYLVKIKQLNASSRYHYPYKYNSSLYNHDVCYLGGYQVHYKGKELIDKFIKPCLNQDFDFAIYGNRLWKKEIQVQALKSDRFFKKEYYDESFDPYYKTILPMADYNILSKNCKIWVNFNAMTQRNMQMNNDRVIWGLACGTFFITDDTIEARRFYKANTDECPVVFSSGDDDLIEKIHYYLEREDKRLEIASRGPQFVKNNRLFTADTVDDIIDLYNHREKYELQNRD